jgi:gas vesicle protein
LSNSNGNTSNGNTSNPKKYFSEYDIMRSPKSSIKLMFNDNQREMKKLKEEIQKMEDKIDDQEIEI